jgi:hypothetical protein
LWGEVLTIGHSVRGEPRKGSIFNAALLPGGNAKNQMQTCVNKDPVPVWGLRGLHLMKKSFFVLRPQQGW